MNHTLILIFAGAGVGLALFFITAALLTLRHGLTRDRHADDLKTYLALAAGLSPGDVENERQSALPKAQVDIRARLTSVTIGDLKRDRTLLRAALEGLQRQSDEARRGSDRS